MEKLNLTIGLYLLGYPITAEYDRNEISKKLKFFLNNTNKYISHIKSINNTILQSEIEIMQKFHNNVISVNSTSTLKDDIDTYLPDDIYIYKDKTKIYRFVRPEFNYIRKRKINPYTMKPISDYIIDDMESKFNNYIQSGTAIEIFNLYLNPKNKFNERSKVNYNGWYEYYTDSGLQDDSIFENLSFSE